jgi:hypothetical protein
VGDEVIIITRNYKMFVDTYNLPKIQKNSSLDCKNYLFCVIQSISHNLPNFNIEHLVSYSLKEVSPPDLGFVSCSLKNDSIYESDFIIYSLPFLDSSCEIHIFHKKFFLEHLIDGKTGQFG